MWNDNELSKMVKGGVPFPMLSDAGGKAGFVYGIYDPDAGVETRENDIKTRSGTCWKGLGSLENRECL